MESESVYGGLFQIQFNEASQLNPACLSIPHVLRKILENFSNSELLQLSLVNKQWNYEARSVLKDRGTSNAHLYPHQPCKDVAVFASHVQQMNVVPYTGIRIRFDHHAEEDDNDLTCGAWDPSFDVIFNRLALKHFAALFDEDWEENHECPALLLMKKILQDHCGVLESLTVGLTCNFKDFIRQTIQDSVFLRLKTLTMRPFSPGLQQAGVILIHMIVSRSPNLQELHLDHPIDVYGALRGSSAVIVIDGEVDPLDDGTRHGLIGPFMLTRMRLEYKAGRNFSMERFNSVVPVVIRKSRTTLHSLSMNSVFAPSLMRYGIPLENVTKLTICLDRHLEIGVPQRVAAHVSAFWGTLQNFDFTRIFPKLNEVEITSSFQLLPGQINLFVDQGNIILPEPSPDRAVNIKHLKIKNFQYSPMNVPFLASMFPHIEKLSIENQDGPVPPYRLISEHWIHLKQLDVQDQRVWRHNLDSAFCGLFPDEIAQLIQKDEEYLKAVNIVPVMPSITCMKDLQTFKLSDCGYGLYYGENDPAYVFSDVTALIAFSRNPKLSVNIQTSPKFENAWSHMKDYASIVLIE